MAGVFLRKCSYCKKYFLPATALSRCCDRIIDIENNKTCKDIGAKSIYNDQIKDDEARYMLRKNKNAYQMRWGRYPASYPRTEFEKWKDTVNILLDRYESGEISSEELELGIALPPIKK